MVKVTEVLMFQVSGFCRISLAVESVDQKVFA